MDTVKKKVLFFISDAEYFFSHRLALAKAAQEKGFQVALACVCHSCEEKARFIQEHITYFPLSYFSRHRLGLWQQWKTFWELFSIYKTYQPDIVHHVAMKPVLIGSLIAKIQRIPRVINALGGLGYVFSGTGWHRLLLRFFVIFGLRFFLRGPKAILILQNQEDQKLLISARINPSCIHLIKGVGVDLDYYTPTAEPKDPPLVISYVGRLLLDKGVLEFVKAASLIKKKKGSAVRFRLVGGQDPQNPTSISTQELKQWQDQKIIDHCGPVSDVRSIYQSSHIVVLPSYREGLPKVLVEAASCGKPIVTTDVPGCRDVVCHLYNGLLVAPQDVKALFDALWLLIHNPQMRLSMGKASRHYAQQHFCEKALCQKVLALYDK